MSGTTYRKVNCRECEIRYQQHLEDCKLIDTLKADSHLSIAELAARRGMKPSDVFVEEIEKRGFEARRMNPSQFDRHGDGAFARADKKSCGVENFPHHFCVPYTAVTPALIKAVCGGGE